MEKNVNDKFKLTDDQFSKLSRKRAPFSDSASKDPGYMSVQSCQTLCDPMNCQAPLSMGFPRQECWSGLPFPSSEDLPDPGIEPASSELAGRFFTTESPRKPNLAHSVQFTCSVLVKSLQPWTAVHQATLSITNCRSCSNSCPSS